eukprot:530179-Hanusia_phi.AAC.1
MDDSRKDRESVKEMPDDFSICHRLPCSTPIPSSPSPLAPRPPRLRPHGRRELRFDISALQVSSCEGAPQQGHPCRPTSAGQLLASKLYSTTPLGPDRLPPIACVHSNRHDRSKGGRDESISG